MVTVTVAVAVAITITMTIAIAITVTLLEYNQGQQKDLNQNVSPRQVLQKLELNLRIIHFTLSLVANNIHLEMEKEQNSWL